MKEVEQLLLDLKRKIFKPVYFLCGEEPHYVDVISTYIENNVLEESDREFNQTVVYGKDIDLAGVVNLAKQFPMMSEYNVVIVKEAQNLKALHKASTSEESTSDKGQESQAIQQFLAYLNQPQLSTILVFCFMHKTIDKRSAVAKALQKKAVFFESKKLYDNQIPNWIGDYVKQKNYTIGPKASYLVAEFLGADLSKISNELNKLLINLPEGNEITPELVQENIGISKDYNVFELQDALAKKDILRANRIINHFAANEKENPSPLVLASLFNYFTKVFRYHYLPNKNKFTAAQALGVNPFFVDGYAQAASNYHIEKVGKIFGYLKEMDLKSKGVNNTGAITYGELLKELVFKILH